MKKFLFLILLAGQLTVSGQNNCPFFEKYIQKGDAELIKGNKANFEAAIDAYSIAMLHCPDSAEVARAKILSVFRAIEKLRIQAERDKYNAKMASKEAEAQRDNARDAVEASDNTALVFKIQKENPTLALRIAEYNYESHLGNAAAATAFHEIVSDTSIKYYCLDLSGHTLAVNSVIFSPNGTMLASGSGDGTVKVWGLETGQELFTLSGYNSIVNSGVFSPDSTRLATGSGDGTVKVWDLASRQELFTLSGHTKSVNSVAFSPDGKKLASGSSDRTVKVWDLASRQELFTLFGHTNAVKSVAFSLDGTMLASGSSDRTVKVWNLEAKQELFTLSGHTNAVNSVAFSPDGKKLASGSSDRTVKVWNLEAKQELFTLSGHTNAVISVAFSPDGEKLASGSSDGTVKVWNLEAKQELFTLSGLTDADNSVAFSPDSKKLASGTSDRKVKVWDLVTRQELFTLSGHNNNVNSVAFSPDGKKLASSGSWDGTVKVWGLDKAEKQELFTLSGHNDNVNSVAFSPDGAMLASGSSDGTVKVWNLETGLELFTLSGHNNNVNSVVFSPDGKKLASSGSWDGTVKVWGLDKAEKQELFTLSGHNDNVNSVAFSPDGTMLASGSSDRMVKVWDLAARQELFTLSGHTNAVTSVAFSPDGTMLASGSWDGTVKVWGLAARQELFTFSGHNDNVKSIAFSPDGTMLVSASSDGMVKVWQVRPYLAQIAVDVNPAIMLRAGVWLKDADMDKLMESSDIAKVAARASNKGQFRRALLFYEKALSKQDSLPWLLAIMILSEKTKIQFDFNRLDAYKNRGEQIQIAEFFEQRGEVLRAITFYEKSVAQEVDVSVLLKIFELSEKTKQPFDRIRLNSITNRGEQIQIARFFEQRGEVLRAITFYEKSVAQEVDVSVLLKIFELSEKTKQPFDRIRLNSITNGGEQIQIARFFEQRGETQEALKFYKKALLQEVSIDMIDKMVNLSKMTNQDFDLEVLASTNDDLTLKALIDYYSQSQLWSEAEKVALQMEAHYENPYNRQNLYMIQLKLGKDNFNELFLSTNDVSSLKSHFKWFTGQSSNQNGSKNRYTWYDKTVRVGERLLKITPEDSTLQKNIARSYNSVAWDGLLSGHFKEAELAVRRGLELIEPAFRTNADFDKTKYYLHTNLPPALLLQGRYEEAIKEYQKIMNDPYPPRLNTHPFYWNIFLKDLNDLDKAGVIGEHRTKMEEIKVMLQAHEVK